MFPDIVKRTVLSESSHDSSACPSNKSNIKLKRSMEAAYVRVPYISNALIFGGFTSCVWHA